jgi:hypothetical protein
VTTLSSTASAGSLGQGRFAWTPSSTLTPGSYTVRVSGSVSPAPTDDSDAFTVS